jgi:predicted phosphate transport protein (TIGR00153 family)
MFLDRVVGFFLPKENRFFLYINSIADNMLVGAQTFGQLATAQGPADFKGIAERMKRLEHEGDELAHLLYEELDKTFVTPLDREDLHALCSALDSILDHAESCANRIVIFRLETLSEPMRKLVGIYQESVTAVHRCAHLLSDLGKSDEINVAFVRVHALENEADQVYRSELQRIFTDPPKDPIELIRSKDILDALERAVDATKSVMDLLHSVVVKNG